MCKCCSSMPRWNCCYQMGAALIPACPRCLSPSFPFRHFSCPSSDCWWKSSQVLLLEVLRVSLTCAGEQGHLMQHFRKILSLLHLCPNLPPSPPPLAWVHCCSADPAIAACRNQDKVPWSWLVALPHRAPRQYSLCLLKKKLFGCVGS